MIEAIPQAIKPHDKYQIEFKLDYELLPGQQTHYQVFTYIFVPQSLGITPSTYAKAEFYRDIQNYIRLKTPALILREFTKEGAGSPLLAIEKIVAAENWTGQSEYRERLINNFKFLSATLKSAIREHFNLIQKRIAEAPPHSKVSLLIHNLVEEFLVETKNIADKYRSFYAAFNLPNIDSQLFTAYKLTDESLSLLIEESAVEMFQIVEAYLKKGDKIDFKQKLSELVEWETRHRRTRGYRSVLKEGDDNEEYTFRVSVLKKYASSVLYLSTAVQREGVELEHFLFSIAAGLSMIFATVVAFYFQNRYGQLTFPFFIALVVGYMFKDRIKELGKQLFAHYLQNTLYDRRTIIRTQDGQHKLGILREKVSFVAEKNLPAPILAARNRDPFTELDNDGQGEYVICYAKDIVLFADAFKEAYLDVPEITGINDIIRYDIRAYLRKMAEPVQPRNYLEAGQLKTVSCHKVYHLNFVSRYRSIKPHGSELERRLRLVLDRRGIKRVEHVPI
ncbi:MAG: hypothetical protein KJ077_42140 [Anaerolineae bacterium]|nr:hypothetical protein [Anaerolineae bacterium]